MIDTELRATLFHGFSDRSRLAILEALSGGERRVGDVVAATGFSQPNVSGHLAGRRLIYPPFSNSGR